MKFGDIFEKKCFCVNKKHFTHKKYIANSDSSKCKQRLYVSRDHGVFAAIMEESGFNCFRCKLAIRAAAGSVGRYCFWAGPKQKLNQNSPELTQLHLAFARTVAPRQVQSVPPTKKMEYFFLNTIVQNLSQKVRTASDRIPVLLYTILCTVCRLEPGTVDNRSSFTAKL